MKKMSQESLAVELDTLLQKERKNFCFSCIGRGNCTCLYSFMDNHVRSLVVKFVVDLKMNNSNDEIDTLVLEWYKKYAKH